MNENIERGLNEEFGKFSPTILQSILIFLTRKNIIARAAVRTRINHLVQKLRPGPIDYNLFGWRFRFFPHENTGDRKALFSPSAFDYKECKFIEKYAPLNEVFLDIGSNIGVYSFRLASTRPDLHIISIEPSSRVFKKLKFNIDLNKLESKIHAIQTALSNYEGHGIFDTERESLISQGGSKKIR